MAFRVEITPRALGDLDAIAGYILSESSFEAAEKWFNGIMGAIRSLRQMPARCPRAAESEILGEDVRLLLYGRRNRRYKVYFVMDHPAKIVRVLHVRHWALRPL